MNMHTLLKKISSIIIAIILTAVTFVTAVGANKVLPVFQAGTVYEAEQAYIYEGKMEILNDGLASGGTALKPRGEYQATAADVTGPMLAFDVSSDIERQNCKLSVKYISKAGSTSFFYRINGGAWTCVYPAKATEYTWFEVPYVSINVGETATRVELAQRVDGITIDQIKISEGEENLPVFNLDTAYEAEQAHVYGTNMTLVDDGAASGGKVLKTSGQYQAKAADVKGPMLGFYVYAPQDLNNCKLMIRYIHKAGSTSFFYKIGNASSWTVTYPPKQTEYVWYEVPYLTLSLSKGNNLIKFAQRTGDWKVDQIKIVGPAKDFAEPSVTDGNIVYPQTMQANRVNNVPAFEDGDNILFIGDSITHGALSGKYLAYLSAFYAGRFPDKKITYLNKAIGGNDAGEAVMRFNYDIINELDAPANKAVILIGTNDMEMYNYYDGTEDNPGEKLRRADNITRYEAYMRTLISKLRQNGVEDIILISPPLYDEWGSMSAVNAKDFNNISRKAAALQYKLSQELEDVYFIDINTPMYAVDIYNKSIKGLGFRLAPDRVHPNDEANWIIAYSILKAQGMDKDVANVSIDAQSQTVNAYNAAVTNLTSTQNAVTYTYSPNALPIAADSLYRGGDELVPITNELNREIIKVTGLADGVYDIKLNGNVVMRATNAQLEEGINIADKKNNPGQQSALKALTAALQRIEHDTAHRTFHYNLLITVSEYGLNYSSNEALITSAQKYSNVSSIAALLEQKENEGSVLATSKAFEDQVYSASVPVSSNVEISLSADQTEPGDITYSYVDVTFPQNTVSIIPDDKTPSISVDRIVFEDENGNELTSLPQSGTVTAKAILRNNTLSDASATLWIASYTADTLDVSAFSDTVSVAPGKETTVSESVTITQASALLKAGVWEAGDSATPLVALAEYPSQNYGIKDVYVNGKELSFDPEVYNYTYMLATEETNAPMVSVTPANTNADIKITQASSTKDSAVIKAGDNTYRISFKISDPHVTQVKINNVVYEKFVPDAYYYELPKASMGEVSAVAGYDVDVSITQPTASNPTAIITTEAINGEQRT